MKRYSKAIVAVSGVLIAIGEAGRDGSLDQADVFGIILALGVAFGVYRIPNKPPAA